MNGPVELLSLEFTIKTAPKRPRYLGTVIRSVTWALSVWDDGKVNYRLSVAGGWHDYYVADGKSLTEVFTHTPDWVPLPPAGWDASLNALKAVTR
ncbi:MAG TPA: hypothetical protein VIK31_03225 [Propionibacteriaceae bacterium]